MLSRINAIPTQLWTGPYLLNLSLNFFFSFPIGFNFTLELCISVLIHWQSMLDCCNDSLRNFGVVIQTILTHLIGWRDESQDALLFSVDLADATDEQLALNINLMRLISLSLDCGGGSELNSNHWDFVLCSLASWIQVSLTLQV